MGNVEPLVLRHTFEIGSPAALRVHMLPLFYYERSPPALRIPMLPCPKCRWYLKLHSGFPIYLDISILRGTHSPTPRHLTKVWWCCQLAYSRSLDLGFERLWRKQFWWDSNCRGGIAGLAHKATPQKKNSVVSDSRFSNFKAILRTKDLPINRVEFIYTIFFWQSRCSLQYYACPTR